MRSLLTPLLPVMQAIIVSYTIFCTCGETTGYTPSSGELCHCNSEKGLHSKYIV
jgi:hypothetical protein